MPRKKQEIDTNKKFALNLADSLRSRARNPTIDDYKPHPKQVDFHKLNKFGRQFIGGNRSGKTVAGATEIIWYARGNHPYKRLPWAGPMRLRAVTVDLIQGLSKIVLPEVRKWINPSDLINGSWEDSYDKQLRTLTFENGSFIEFLTYEQDLEKFAGTSRHACWFDEEPPEDIFTECKLRLLDVSGHWWMTMTPVEGMTWTYDKIYEVNDPNVQVIVVDMDDNPYLSPEGKELVLSGLTADEIKARKQGRYVKLGGLIYEPLFDDSVHIIDPIVPPPSNWLHVASLDHGFTNATAWLWGAVDERGRMIIYDEHYKSGLIVAQHALEVHRRNEIHGFPPEYYVGDPSIRNKDPITGTSVHLEYIDCGIPVVLGNNDVRAGIDKVKRKLIGKKGVPELYITRNCENLLWELKRYSWAIWKHRGDQYDKNKKEEPQKKDDHAMDSLRYLIASRPEKEEPRAPARRTNTLGAPESVPAFDKVVDKELLKVSRGGNADPHLGEDY